MVSQWGSSLRWTMCNTPLWLLALLGILPTCVHARKTANLGYCCDKPPTHGLVRLTTKFSRLLGRRLLRCQLWKPERISYVRDLRMLTLQKCCQTVPEPTGFTYVATEYGWMLGTELQRSMTKPSNGSFGATSGSMQGMEPLYQKKRQPGVGGSSSISLFGVALR